MLNTTEWECVICIHFQALLLIGLTFTELLHTIMSATQL